jgi:hypothetical protein
MREENDGWAVGRRNEGRKGEEEEEGGREEGRGGEGEE